MMRTPVVSVPSEAAYCCGPVRLELRFGDGSWREALHGLLAQYDAPWPPPTVTVRVSIGNGTRPPQTAEPLGEYLQTYRLRVDCDGDRLYSLSKVGVWMDFDAAAAEARIAAPSCDDRVTLVEEVEQQLVLVLTRAWAMAGWTPLHAGALIPPGEDRCVFVCAPSGVGKTTFIASLVRRGWRTLGDDKLLMRREGPKAMARALAYRFHLHPTASRWFPEAGDIGACPRYSRWTDKRIVRIEGIWPDRLAATAMPAAAVHLERTANDRAVRIERLDPVSAVVMLLGQVAIPTDARHAEPLISCVTSVAAGLPSARVRLGNGAFDDPTVAKRLDEGLRELMP